MELIEAGVYDKHQVQGSQQISVMLQLIHDIPSYSIETVTKLVSVYVQRYGFDKFTADVFTRLKLPGTLVDLKTCSYGKITDSGSISYLITLGALPLLKPKRVSKKDIAYGIYCAENWEVMLSLVDELVAVGKFPGSQRS